jgi:hypothetical protein
MIYCCVVDGRGVYHEETMVRKIVEVKGGMEELMKD